MILKVGHLFIIILYLLHLLTTTTGLDGFFYLKSSVKLKIQKLINPTKKKKKSGIVETYISSNFDSTLR